MVIVEWSPYPFLNLGALFHNIFSPTSIEEEKWESSVMGFSQPSVWNYHIKKSCFLIKQWCISKMVQSQLVSFLLGISTESGLQINIYTENHTTLIITEKWKTFLHEKEIADGIIKHYILSLKCHRNLETPESLWSYKNIYIKKDIFCLFFSVIWCS